ncbi:MAG: biotin holocarboxylase synthetase [Chrysothrix sp. TS-e1954]|nr:MAG: biotin holocarboxylase synthetase [Chrysothrix sp. TS-e1954]
MQYVKTGGSYLGLCAGGYYGSARCEFEVGKGNMEVTGNRQLQFFPGSCVGSVTQPFKYDSEATSRAMLLQVNQEEEEVSRGKRMPFKAYVNGGGFFWDADNLFDKGIRVLATYADDRLVASHGRLAAVVHCQVRDGQAILTGPHIEYTAEYYTAEYWSKYVRHGNQDVIDALREDDEPRNCFFQECLQKLGLNLNPTSTAPPPTPTDMYLSFRLATDETWVTEAMTKFSRRIGGLYLLDGGHNNFIIQRINKENPEEPHEISAAIASHATSGDARIWKRLCILHRIQQLPVTKHYFNSSLFFYTLEHLRRRRNGNYVYDIQFGDTLLYAEVVDSTNTLLELNPGLFGHMPSGTVFTATTQLSGRGRGNNIWLSPRGSLMFSVVLRHSSTSTDSPVALVQYLAAMAVVEGVKRFLPYSTKQSLYEGMPIKLKWPNDIYILDPDNADASVVNRDSYTKIGGVLVNSSYQAGGEFTLVVGIGLNVNADGPTTCLNSVLKKIAVICKMKDEPDPYTMEPLLGSILVAFERLFHEFHYVGFSGLIKNQYLKEWLHTGQIVKLEKENVRVKIQSITSDHGLLIVEEVKGPVGSEEGTGRKFALQPDANSFDFFKGLIKVNLTIEGRGSILDPNDKVDA